MPPKKATGAATKKASAPAEHPPYKDMIKEAIAQLKERNGSSRQALKKYIQSNFKGIKESNFDTQFNAALKRGVIAGDFTQPKGPSGPVKLQKKADATKTATKPAKAAGEKATKKAVPKKATATKKASTTKTTKPKASTTTATATKTKTASTTKKPKKTTTSEKPAASKTKTGRVSKTTSKAAPKKSTATKKSAPKKKSETSTAPATAAASD